ncbi:IS3 family transposase [Megasphaera elsdenii]|uniref:IS3 family transposase n=1 Tax=Megasphaera elsdenii TaxID=907 RepID=UPI0033961BE6
MTIAIYRSVQEEAENAHQAERRFSVSGVLSELDVSSSGYYDWAARKPSKQAQHRKEMKKKIQTIYDDSKQIYGAPKIAQVMQQNGDSISERTVGVYMRQMGIQACWVKHYTVTTRNSDFDVALVNILQECFNPEEPDQVWCSDITYIWTAEGFVYLESIMDLFSRKIIAWNLARNLDVAGIVKMLQEAKQCRKPGQLLVIHSDRGCQYVSQAYIRETSQMRRSYSKKGYPWDNACIESFHSLIKREWLNRFKIQNYQQAYLLVFEYINTFYNTVRIHSHCNYMSPNDYEKLYADFQKHNLRLGI